MTWRVRPVRVSDAAAIAAIYSPIVECTAISFEEVAPSEREVASRIEKLSSAFPWLVAESNAGIIGYAYACAHRERAAYRWSVDVSAYVDGRTRRAGVARSLYEALFRLLEAQGYHRAFAGITLPNDASIGLHRAMGFEAVGIYRESGYKLGAWRDTSWWQRSIGSANDAPRETIDMSVLDERIIERACQSGELEP